MRSPIVLSFVLEACSDILDDDDDDAVADFGRWLADAAGAWAAEGAGLEVDDMVLRNSREHLASCTA